MEFPVTDQVADFGPPTGSGSAALARDFTRRTLTGWSYRGDHDDVVLVVSELVANVDRHAVGPAVLRLTGGPDRVLVEVSDGSPAVPWMRPHGTDGGWGIPLIDRLTLRWGVTPHGRGKVVWCELG
ncbi:ATP-binding protein [Actinosynnema sp. NPDC047251]|uniref:ATP-binding protein n=1 Tax=Saccharothrix espanaensis TaxID=103731 RepID=UPI0002FB1C88|nr:ATP-binding protein [Saccharothrix espanaensis]